MNTTYLQIILCDRDRAIARAWEQEFKDCPDVEIRLGDLLEVQADAYISPANSYGPKIKEVCFILTL